MTAGRWAAAALLALLAGCGVPTGGPAETIPSGEVPYGLTSATPTPPPAPAPEPVPLPTRVHLVGPDDRLVPEPRQVDGASVAAQLDELLDELAAGPTPAERERQLSTALPPEVELDVIDVTGGTAVVGIGGTAGTASGMAGRLAVAQVVLTATSVPGVGSVVLTQDGERIEAPLPSGELTAEALTAADYAAALAPDAPPS